MYADAKAARCRQEPPPAEDSDLKSPEWKVLSAADSNRNTRDFSLRAVAAPVGFEDCIAKVVLADRLREVRALTGFTRIESPGDYSDPTEIPPEPEASGHVTLHGAACHACLFARPRHPASAATSTSTGRC